MGSSGQFVAAMLGGRQFVIVPSWAGYLAANGQAHKNVLLFLLLGLVRIISRELDPPLIITGTKTIWVTE